MLAAVRIATLSLVIVCLVPAYDAWRASTPDAWDTAFSQMQTTACYVGLFIAFAVVLKITISVIVNALGDNAWLALSRVMQSLLFVLLNFHVFLMAWLTYSDGLPWSRFWEFFTDPYVYPITIVMNVIWLCAFGRRLLSPLRR